MGILPKSQAVIGLTDMIVSVIIYNNGMRYSNKTTYKSWYYKVRSGTDISI